MAVLAGSNTDPDRRAANALDALHDHCADDLIRVNRLILAQMQSDVPLVGQVAGHIIAAGGKRLRPLLTLACAKLCGYGGDTHLGLAAAVEFIHTATLLHDDVVDHSDLRRGRDSANALWGNQPSVLVGDFLFSRAFQQMVRSGSLKVLDILSATSVIIAEGEVRQLVGANDISVGESQYLCVVRAKTAALFAAACRIGAVVAGRDEGEELALERYGLNLGIAFQLADDCLDYSGAKADIGKTVGDDFREGKITLPVLLAVQRGDTGERDFWRRTLESQDQAEDDLAHATALLERHGALNDTLERARGYAATAIEALAPFPRSEIRTALTDVASFCVDRVY